VGGSVHFVEAFSRNGMRFKVLDEGPADAETVVLLHWIPEQAPDELAAHILERIRSVSPAT